VPTPRSTGLPSFLETIDRWKADEDGSFLPSGRDAKMSVCPHDLIGGPDEPVPRLIGGPAEPVPRLIGGPAEAAPLSRPKRS
jgi:hypothetical protein